jgi:7-cyano-7-deazaguanine synthase
VILLSGGLDSATSAAVALREGYELYALTVDYGQRHRFEIQAARRLATTMKIQQQREVSIDLSQFGGSALTDQIDVPKDRTTDEMDAGIPVTYVPARNTVLLSLALAMAEVLGAGTVFVGINAVDYSGYPDCRPEFVAAFERLANLATKASVEGLLNFSIRAPLLEMKKAEIIRLGTSLEVDYGLTHTCYDPNDQGISCGHCDACRLRLEGFKEAGLVDPLRYQRS